MPSDKVVLAQCCVLRKLEAPFVYNILEDQLYELDDEAFEFLEKCNGRNPLSRLMQNGSADIKASIEYLLDEGIIAFGTKRNIKTKASPIPSLRYLLLNVTNKCNLACKHCYVKQGNTHIGLRIFEKAVSQFEDMGGLKLMLSGGEPLLHPEFYKLMELLPSYELRVVLLSNGTLIDGKTAGKLSNYVHEVQVSIDGTSSHDLLRGKGSYDKAMRGILNMKSFSIPVSIATMVHGYDTGEFEEMEKLFSGLKAVSWSVDVPCVTGNLKENRHFVLDASEASQFLRYGYGSGGHESSGNYACGSHLCAVSPEGKVSKCGFFEERVGDVNDLRQAWKELCRKYLWTLDMLECRECRLIYDCRGGCRYRAKAYRGIFAPDPVLCHANSVMDFL